MFNIAIDGPAGSGKSTVAKKLAKYLSDKVEPTIYVDTGALYRALAYFLFINLSENDLKKEDLIMGAIEDVQIDIEYIDGVQHVYTNGKDVTEFIRTEEISRLTSDIARLQGVRKHLIGIQRDLALRYNTVMDGRDIGSVVLPNADLKIYLEASIETRAERRLKDLKNINNNLTLDELINEIKERDLKDETREVAPLMITHDAIRIDTSDIGVDDVVKKIIGYFRNE